jgi:GT2 family glycosyltransferase
MFDVTASIVVYNNPPDQLSQAISSFLNTDLHVHLYILDNSPDYDVLPLYQDSRITYIFNGRNLGFGAAHNIALRSSIATARYHVVLNPDVYFGPEVLDTLFHFASSRTEIGLLMPKVLHPDGSIQHLCKLLPTPADLFIRRFLPQSLKHLAKDRLDRYEFRNRNYDSLLSVPFLSGCFMMINCAALAQVGVFDERFFMYLEDVDLCRRIHQQFDTIYFPEVSIFHHYKKGSYRSGRLLLHHLISALLYFQKWGWYSDKERADINRRASANAPAAS